MRPAQYQQEEARVRADAGEVWDCGAAGGHEPREAYIEACVERWRALRLAELGLVKEAA